MTNPFDNLNGQAFLNEGRTWLGAQEAEEQSRPLTVYELTRELKRLLEEAFRFVYVEGEVSNFKRHTSGHLYFTLKDEEDRASINCVMWKTDAVRLRSLPKDGDKVEVRGRITVYEPRGQYQIVVNEIRPAGLGRLFLEFQRLKEKLEREGLFAPERKRPLPPFPRAIGVVTSQTGAAIRDILKVLGRRAPQIPVFIYPVRVQGAEAAREIAHGIQRMNELALADVLIVGRGGGSLEDLWAFNEEVVARAIAASSIPVISAVGHEVDFTIADFVADVRAPTPSAAAEIVAKSSGELLEQISALRRRLVHTIDRRLAPLREVRHLRQRMVGAVQRRCTRLETALQLRARIIQSVRSRVSDYRSAITRFSDLLRLKPPMSIVNETRQRLDDLVERAAAAFSERLARAKHCAELLSARLKALDPTSILARGYSITYDAATHQILRRADDTAPGRVVRVVLHQGELRANVVATTGAQDCGGQHSSAPSAPQPELPLFTPDDVRGTQQ